MILEMLRMPKALFLLENKFMKKNKTNFGFTLIELLMVIAIIGILAGILIPTVGAVRKQANVAASKSQLSNYLTSLQMFKGEYGYYPFTGEIDLSAGASGATFMAALSGRPEAAAATAGNRRRIAFHSFSESEFYRNADDTIDETRLADRFSNPKIFLFIDDNGDGVIEPSPEANSGVNPPAGGELRSSITAWVIKNDDPVHGDQPGYSLWD